MISQEVAINNPVAVLDSAINQAAEQPILRKQLPPVSTGQPASASSIPLCQRRPLPVPAQGKDEDQESQTSELTEAFRQLCEGSARPGGGIGGDNAQLEALVQDNLSVINNINSYTQKIAGRGECPKITALGFNDTGIFVPVSKSGLSRLTLGRMGYDMNLSDGLIEDSFYQDLFLAEGKGLEIGAGYGEICLRLLRQKNVQQMVCIEPQITQLLTIQARACKKYPNSLNKLTLINGLFPQDGSISDQEPYDFIVCHRVFSVTSAEVACQIVNRANRLLKTGGRLFLLSLCDQHPNFQKYKRDKGACAEPNDTKGLIEVATQKVLPDQAYNLPENTTFISQRPFERFLENAGFTIKTVTFPATTNVAGEGRRNIAFIAEKTISK